jgi:hypothetical protein
MDIVNFIAKFLPPEAQKALTQALAMAHEEGIARDIDIALTEVEKELSAAAKNPAADKKLRNAFNDAASLSSIGQDYLNDGKISMFTSMKLASQKGRFKDSFKTLHDAFNAQQPAALALTESLRKNDTFYSAIKRLVANTHGRLFRLEDGENGCGYAVDLMTGQSMRVLLKKEDYAEIKAILAAQKKTPPAPPSP